MPSAEGAAARLAERGPLVPLPTQRTHRRLALIVPAAVLLVATLLRLVGLEHPPRMYFDEVYYAEDALAVVDQGVEDRRSAHPPLGPALIALGVSLAGSGPVGWRVAAAVAGTLLVGLTYVAARRLGAGRLTATSAMALVALDGLALTMSRIAMLDVFLALFVLAGFCLLLPALDDPGSGRWGRRLAWAGAAFGAATAVKWSGALGLLAAGTATAWSVAAWARRRRPPGRMVVGAAGWGVLGLLVVPAVVYLASYTGWFVNFEETAAAEQRCPDGGCQVGLGGRAEVWVEEQLALVGYHRRLPATHPYRSSPLGWPLLARPVLHYFEDCEAGDPRAECEVAPGEEAKILGLGNPVLWWLGVPAVAVVGWRAIVLRRRWALLLVLFLLTQHLPWLLVGKEGYLFYMTPLVPFLALALAFAVRTMGRSSRVALPALVVAALAAFVYFSPIWYGLPMAEEVLDGRMWLDSWR